MSERAKEPGGPAVGPGMEGQPEDGGAGTTKRRVSPWIIGLAAVGGLVALCILACVGVQFYPLVSEWAFGGRMVNAPAPEFTLKTLDGREFTLSELRDRPVVINFWATWCPSCVEEVPEIRAAYHEHEDDVHLLTVSVDSDRDALTAFASENGLDFPVLFDEDGTVSGQYRVRGIPVTVFVDTEGVLFRRHVGSLTRARFTEYLEQMRADGEARRNGE